MRKRFHPNMPIRPQRQKAQQQVPITFKCPYCHRGVTDDETCPHCGAKVV